MYTWITDLETFKPLLLENCDRLKTAFSKSLNSFSFIVAYLSLVFFLSILILRVGHVSKQQMSR